MKTILRVLTLALVLVSVAGAHAKAVLSANVADTCKTRYKTENEILTTTVADGYYVVKVQFTLSKNSDIPVATELTAAFTDCKGNTVYVKLKVAYDKATGTFTAAQAIPQSKECPLTLAGLQVGFTNPCGETTYLGGEVQAKNGIGYLNETKNTGFSFKTKKG